MKTFRYFIVLLTVTLLVTPCFAQGTSPAASPAAASASPAAASGQPSAAEMQKMMEMAKPGPNHKLLADMAGNWAYTIKYWMNPDPNAKPEESKGTATRKMIMDGRYSTMDVSGKMEMPGPDGKMKTMQFKGMGIDAYDNVKQKFTSAWVDNMGTGVTMSEGTYDPATKTFTYTGEYEAIPGMKQKIRETLKVTDKDHMVFEWYEDRAGKETKTMEISYTRKK